MNKEKDRHGADMDWTNVQCRCGAICHDGKVIVEHPSVGLMR